jgi:hypothetical protein
VGDARLFALVNLAMADGFIGGFESKYHYNYWRPVTGFTSRARRMPATSRAHASELGLRTRIAACESSVGEHLFTVSGKAENMKLRKIMDVGEDSVKKAR